MLNVRIESEVCKSEFHDFFAFMNFSKSIHRKIFAWNSSVLIS